MASNRRPNRVQIQLLALDRARCNPILDQDGGHGFQRQGGIEQPCVAPNNEAIMNVNRFIGTIGQGLGLECDEARPALSPRGPREAA